MRRYEIVITDQNGSPKTVSDPQGLYNFTGAFASASKAGVPNPGALNIELDIPVSVYNSPLGGASLKIYGVGLPMMAQAANFNPSIDGSTYCNIKISGGMTKGLPLAKQDQYGVILNSRIQQAFGNWQGTSQTLDFIMVQPAGTPIDPLNIQFKCVKDAQLTEALQTCLKTAFPKVDTISVNISAKLVAPEDIVKTCSTLSELSTFLNQKSKSIIKDKNYPGIQISFFNNQINVYDYSSITESHTTEIEFTDLIGQPTWISPYTLTFKTVMRGDLKLGDKVIMPKQSAQKGLILTMPGSMSQYKSTVDFQGEFYISQIRHQGIFRQGSADSWVTVVQAFSLKAFSL